MSRAGDPPHRQFMRGPRAPPVRRGAAATAARNPAPYNALDGKMLW